MTRRGAPETATIALPLLRRQETSVQVADLLKPGSVIAELRGAGADQREQAGVPVRRHC
jgi:hypothetical protein